MRLGIFSFLNGFIFKAVWNCKLIFGIYTYRTVPFVEKPTYHKHNAVLPKV
jgi:hypothetical protein